MKKLITIALVAITTLFAGCELSESNLVATANISGNITMLTWFSIDDPSQEVKTVLKDVIGSITKASVDVGSGKTYLDSLLPQVQEIALKQEKLNDYQKTLINAGAVAILNGIDTFIANNEKVKKNAELVSKVVGAYGEGCLAVLNMKEDSAEVKRARGVYGLRGIRCRGGKFVKPSVGEIIQK